MRGEQSGSETLTPGDSGPQHGGLAGRRGSVGGRPKPQRQPLSSKPTPTALTQGDGLDTQPSLTGLLLSRMISRCHRTLHSSFLGCLLALPRQSAARPSVQLSDSLLCRTEV